MTAAAAAISHRAQITLWQSLTNTTGEPLDTTWGELFASFCEPAKYLGTMSHPGWSAAVLEPCVREDQNVRYLTALVLDYDSGVDIEAAAALWDDWYGFIHTTRKHAPSAHRFRVILPLSRNVSPDEYKKLYRWAYEFAGSAHHELDKAVKNISRYWFRPGTQTGEPPTTWGLGSPTRLLDPDTILRSADILPPTKPTGSSVEESVMGKLFQARGWLGKLVTGGKHIVLCPWSDQHTSGYAWDGSSVLFPPAVGKTLGWFHCSHSHCAGRSVDDVISLCGEDELRAAGWEPQRLRLAPPPSNQQTIPSDWHQLLSVTNKGKLRSEPSNVAVILSHDERWKGVLAYNEMAKTPVLLQPAPWTPECQHGSKTGPMSDSDVTRVRIWLTRSHNFDVSGQTAMEGIDIAARGAAFHPVRSYLDGLQWDGVKRVDALARDVFGNTEALAAIMVRKFMVSAVARAYRPGCKVDTSLILVGPQGWRKSSFFAAIAGEWFVDSAIVLGDKDAYLQIHTAWIYEVAEIDSLMRSRDAEAVKAFASSGTDTFRAPYGRSTQSHPRSCVIVGTTNQDRFLTDDTGSRRWWCVQIHKVIDVAALAAQRDQLWAEAVALYHAGESWWLSPEEEALRTAASKERDTVVEDPWYDVVADGVANCNAVATKDILTRNLMIPVERHTSQLARRVASILRHLGWRPGKSANCSTRVWRRPGGA